MEQGGAAGDILNNHIIIVDLGSQLASHLELLAPADLLLSQEEVKHLSTLFCSAFLFFEIISLDIDVAYLAFGELETMRKWLE